ncbi:TetR/AcrR family transcriptional regulator [Elstera cyanobacteriorum]|uniref:TetR/AcrR family transcriptional regulator n=1 Tax=Elstera cyanobacteriorum TaxID=2022747 RepID=UPI002352CED7|nr:TetR/AcrR family transcriptional regulator [Elstera cyanobacteriorum]MCK6444581.1 TetR/AcrR family transcriptional regulator [Elstera cyanobacteriorum]
MARPKGNDNKARERLLEAAGRGFRMGGYGGIGVDGLAKEAGLTSGAFYSHFGSKAQAFKAALIDGLVFLRSGIAQMRAQFPDAWQKTFVDFYLKDRMQVELAEACALPTFIGDAARADPETRDAYSAEILRLQEEIAQSLDGEDRERRALVLMSLLAGGAGLARAVNNSELRDAILATVTDAAKKI